MGHLREISESFSQNWKMVLENKNIDLIQGTGKSVTSNSILVETAGGEESVFASKVIIATGSVNKEISALPFDGKRLVSGDSLLDFDDLPRQILIVGGQAQGCELATLLSRIGCKVFICDSGERLVNGQNEDLTGFMEQEMRRQKIKLLLNKRVLSIYKKSDNINVSLEGGVQFPTEIIFLTQERKPCSQIVADSGVRLGEYGEILIDETLQTSQEGVYAIGSVTRCQRNPRLSEEEARVAVMNAIGNNKRLHQYRTPFVVYSYPEVASVGCSADDAHHKGFGPGVEGVHWLDALNPGYSSDKPRGLLKLVAERSTRKIIGCQIVAPDASDWITFAALAIKKGLTLKDLAQLSSDSEGISRAFQEAAKAVLGSLKSL